MLFRYAPVSQMWGSPHSRTVSGYVSISSPGRKAPEGHGPRPSSLDLRHLSIALRGLVAQTWVKHSPCPGEAPSTLEDITQPRTQGKCYNRCVIQILFKPRPLSTSIIVYTALVTLLSFCSTVCQNAEPCIQLGERKRGCAAPLRIFSATHRI